MPEESEVSSPLSLGVLAQEEEDQFVEELESLQKDLIALICQLKSLPNLSSIKVFSLILREVKQIPRPFIISEIRSTIQVWEEVLQSLRQLLSGPNSTSTIQSMVARLRAISRTRAQVLEQFNALLCQCLRLHQHGQTLFKRGMLDTNTLRILMRGVPSWLKIICQQEKSLDSRKRKWQTMATPEPLEFPVDLTQTKISNGSGESDVTMSQVEQITPMS